MATSSVPSASARARRAAVAVALRTRSKSIAPGSPSPATRTRVMGAPEGMHDGDLAAFAGQLAGRDEQAKSAVEERVDGVGGAAGEWVVGAGNENQ